MNFLNSDIRPFVDLFARVSWRERDTFLRTAAENGYSTVAVIPAFDHWTDTSEELKSWHISDKEDSNFIALPMAVQRDNSFMAEIRLMKDSGAGSLFYGGYSIGGNPVLLRNTLAYCADIDVRIALIPNEPILSDGGLVNEGRASSLSGMKGIPAVGEILGAQRAMEFSKEYGTAIHLHSVSTAGTIDEIKRYRSEGVDVTCSVTIPHLCYSEENLINSEWNAEFKTQVPLRSEEDRIALWRAIADGTVDAVTSGHSSLKSEDKKVPFEAAPCGISSMPGAIDDLLEIWNRDMRDTVPLSALLKCLSTGPLNLLGLESKHSVTEIESVLESHIQNGVTV